MCFLQFNHLCLSDKEIKMTSLRIRDKESKPVNFSGKDPILKPYFKEVIFFFLTYSYSLIHFKSIERFKDLNGLWTFFLLHKKSSKGHRKLMLCLWISDELTQATVFTLELCTTTSAPTLFHFFLPSWTKEWLLNRSRDGVDTLRWPWITTLLHCY